MFVKQSSIMLDLIKPPRCLTHLITPFLLLPLFFYQCFLSLSVLLNSSTRCQASLLRLLYLFFLWCLCLCSTRLFPFISGTSFLCSHNPQVSFLLMFPHTEAQCGMYLCRSNEFRDKALKAFFLQLYKDGPRERTTYRAVIDHPCLLHCCR